MDYTCNYKKEHYVKFGFCENQNRGNSKALFNPPKLLRDDYYWFRDDNRENKEVLNLLSNLNNELKLECKNYKDTELQLFNEMKSRMKDNVTSYPFRHYDTNYLRYSKYLKGNGHPIYYRSNLDHTNEVILLDVNTLSKDKDNCDVTSTELNPDGNIFSYAVDFNGNEVYEIKLLDITNNKYIDNNIPNLLYADYCWSPTGNHIYYIGHDNANRMNKLFIYDINKKKSINLYTENDSLFSVTVNVSDNNKYILVSVSSSETSENYYINPYIDPLKLNLVKTRVTNLQYDIEFMDDNNLIILTNKDNSINFKLMYANINNIQHWNDLLPYEPNKFITSISIFKTFIVISYRENGLTQLGLLIKNNITAGIKKIPFKDQVYTVNLLSTYNLKYDSNKIIFSYETMILPYRLIEFNINTNKTKILYEKEVPNYNSDMYDSKLLFIKSHDNESIPVTMCYRKDLFRHYSKFKDSISIKLDDKYIEPQPLLLYGYGAYGVCIEPEFNHKWVSLMDRSIICCIAHVRGGSEKGYDWYINGKMKNKLNSFKDFISCAEYLINLGITSSDRLIAEGRSAGGLLMGSILTMRPDLFRTVILGVPFVDALVTMCDPTIPLTTPEWEEWGNPNIPEQYKWISEYSPMQHIKNLNYPNTLILCGLHDPRVQYWEPVKFHMKLKDNLTDTNKHLIKIDMNKGHFSNTDRYRSIREYAFQYTFILKNL